MRTTHTYATLEVSAATYDEIAAKLKEAGYDHAFDDGAIDMHGIGLVRIAPDPKSVPLDEQLRLVTQERDELKRWAETPPDGYCMFMQLWGACVRLVEKAGFKALFRHMEELENKLNAALDEIKKLRGSQDEEADRP